MRASASEWPWTDVRCAPRSPAAQTPSVYQVLVSPPVVVTRAWTVMRLAPGVSAFHDATRRVKLACGWTLVVDHMPLSAPGARASWSPSRAVASKVPALKAAAEAKRVNWIAAAGGCAALAGSVSAHSAI